MIFCVVREMAKVVEKDVISPGSESSSEDISAAGGYIGVKQANSPYIIFRQHVR